MKPARRRLDPRVRAALAALGIDERLIGARGLKPYREARRLAPAGVGTDSRDKFLEPQAAKAWQRMKARAAREGVELLLVSAFRSLEFQVVLIRGKLERGRSIDEILTVNAPPGFSEHHTGRAIDIGTSDCPPLEEDFEKTAAFAWLQHNAGRFGFTLSYPRGNREGYLYEPWHWCYQRKRPIIAG